MLFFVIYIFRNPNWWKRRTALERALTLISIVCLIAVVALVVSLVVVIVNEQIKQSDNSKSAAAALDGSHMQKVFDTDSSSSADNKLKNNEKNKAGTSKNEDLCLTPGCVHSASKMLQMMDDTVDPCDDFYSYACGTFTKDTIIPDDKTSVNTFSKIGDELQIQLKTLIVEPIMPDEPKPFKLAKQLYNACMNKSESLISTPRSF